jgi:hypothetical protein
MRYDDRGEQDGHGVFLTGKEVGGRRKGRGRKEMSNMMFQVSGE